MTILSLIVATAHNNIIGKGNTMPWHLPADLAYFKKMTLGKPVIMGRKTFESIGGPLPNRRNIIITRDPHYQAEGVDIVDSIDKALAVAKGVEEVMVIGGGTIYRHCIEQADRLYVTHIDAQIDGDTYFPDYDTQIDWQQVHCDTYLADDKNAYDMKFCTYQRQ